MNFSISKFLSIGIRPMIIIQTARTASTYSWWVMIWVVIPLSLKKIVIIIIWLYLLLKKFFWLEFCYSCWRILLTSTLFKKNISNSFIIDLRRLHSSFRFSFRKDQIRSLYSIILVPFPVAVGFFWQHPFCFFCWFVDMFATTK